MKHVCAGYVIRGSSLLSEVEPVSFHLRELATVALKAVELIDLGRMPEVSWHTSVSKMLDAHEKLAAEVTIAVIPAIQQLVDAAASRD